MSSQPSPSVNDVNKKNSDYLAFDQLPSAVVENVIQNVSFEGMSRLRQTCKFLKVHSERQLNEGFFRLERQISSSAAKLKKLPKKDSERRSHPLDRYSEVFTALRIRSTLLSLTYKKFIDKRICCFYPGKVLDLAYGVMKQIETHLANAALGQNVAALDVNQILKDFRDYSSMAMEHFKENIALHFSNKPTIFRALLASPVNVPTFPSNNRVNYTNIVSNHSTDKNEDVGKQIEALRNEMRTGFKEKDGIIDEQRKEKDRIIDELAQTRQFVGQVVAILGQVGMQDEWDPAFMSELDQISAGCQISGTHAPIEKRIRKNKKKSTTSLAYILLLSVCLLASFIALLFFSQSSLRNQMLYESA